MSEEKIDKIVMHSQFKDRNIIRKNLILETCGQKDHKKGCYIRFKKGKFLFSVERHDAIVDYDRNHNIIGIEFYEGLE